MGMRSCSCSVEVCGFDREMQWHSSHPAIEERPNAAPDESSYILHGVFVEELK